MKKKLISLSLLFLSLLTACQKDELISREEGATDVKVNNVNKTQKEGISIDQIQFNIATQPFDVVELGREDDFRSNAIRLTNKNNDKPPFVSIASEDITESLYARVVGAGDQFTFNINELADGKKRTAYQIKTNADGSQSILINWYQVGASTWFFKDYQYLCMFYNGDIWSTQNIYEHCNDNLCLVKNNEINKREIPLLTDLKKAVLSKAKNNGGGDPYNTAIITTTFKPGGSLIGMSFINEVGEDIQIQKINILKPYAFAYQVHYDIGDITHNTGAGAKYDADSFTVPCFPRNVNNDYSFLISASPSSTDALELKAGKKTDGRVYLWGYPLEDKKQEPVIAELEFVYKNDPRQRLRRSIPQVIKPKDDWASGKAYRCNFRVRAEQEYFDIFADDLRTELVSGVTLDAINKMPDGLWKDIALKMFNGTYDREFRVRDYKLYMHPHGQKDVMKTNPWGIMENPTGIEVQAGDKLVVLVGDLHGATNVKLRIQDLSEGGRGFTPSDDNAYRIKEGLNTFVARAKGLVYLEYLSEDWSKIEKDEYDIKMHIATGSVNGFFSSLDPQMKDRDAEILAKAQGEYFDLIGKHMLITFPTADYREVLNNGGATSLREIIDMYDKLVRSEMELLGCYKYDNASDRRRIYANRIYMHEGNAGNMFATHYHVVGFRGSGKLLLNVKNLTAKDSYGLWGPAHEVGHMCQTSGFNWWALGEVSNNIMSLYISTTAFAQRSRMIYESINGRKDNRFTRAFNMQFVKGRAFPEAENAERFISMWQLQLFFGNVLGMSPEQRDDKGGFYPDLYEYLRTHNRGSSSYGDSNDGIEQANFCYIASISSGYNLIPFFEKWGYFKAFDDISMDNDNYKGKAFKITQGYIDEIKQKIKDANLKALPNQAIEYINDLNYSYFKDELHVVEGLPARWDGNSILIENWQNVVAYEVWDKDYGSQGAKLLYVSNGFDTKTNSETIAKLSEVNTDIDNSNYNKLSPDMSFYLYAVDVNNQRIRIPIN